MSTGILVAVGGADFEATLLKALNDPLFHVVRRCVDVPDLLAAAALQQAKVALVSAQLRGIDRTVVARLRDHGVEVVGWTAETSSADEAALRRLGVTLFAAADDVISVPEVVTVAGAGPLDVGEPQNGEPAETPVAKNSGSVLAVWGPTGAPGRSVTALGLGAELARLGADTLVVDADVYGGACAPLLGLLDESSGLLAAARAANSGALTPQTLAQLARRVSPRLRVLTGLPRADRWTEVKPPLLRDVFDAARALCTFTVVDCGFAVETDEEVSYDLAVPRRNGATIEALTAADLVVVVGSADPLGLSRLIRAVHELSVVLPGTSPYLVVNRVRDSLGWSTDEMLELVARATGASQLRTLPEDRPACDKAMVHGRTLTEAAPESPLTKALGRLAAEFVGVPDVVLVAAPGSGQAPQQPSRRFSRR